MQWIVLGLIRKMRIDHEQLSIFLLLMLCVILHSIQAAPHQLGLHQHHGQDDREDVGECCYSSIVFLFLYILYIPAYYYPVERKLYKLLL